MTTTIQIVTGILGSGKTTLTRHLIEGSKALGDNPAVVVGEFAEVGFDADMLRDEGAFVHQIVSTGRGDSAKSYLDPVRELATSGYHRRVFLETSGVAELDRIAGEILADPEIQKHAVIGRTTTVLDAGSVEVHSNDFSEQFWSQVAVADHVAVNKTDKNPEVGRGWLADKIREVNPTAVISYTYMGQCRRAYALDPLPDEQVPRILLGLQRARPREFEAFVYKSKLTCYDRLDFGHKLLNLPGKPRVARFKGYLRVHDRSYMVNGLPGQLDWDNTPVTGSTAIAFIGLDLDADRERITKWLDDELERQQEDVR